MVLGKGKSLKGILRPRYINQISVLSTPDAKNRIYQEESRYTPNMLSGKLFLQLVIFTSNSMAMDIGLANFPMSQPGE